MSRELDLAKWETWRRRLRAFEREETTVARFCQHEGVSVATFYLWRRKLGHQPRRRPRQSAKVHARSRRSAVQHAQNSGVLESRRRKAVGVGFVPISITSASSLEVWLPGGTRLLVPCHDREVIRTVIAALTHDSHERHAC
jgi:hypothetical protein